eukprot:420811-Hanusia_phi.AAC.2
MSTKSLQLCCLPLELLASKSVVFLAGITSTSLWQDPLLQEGSRLNLLSCSARAVAPTLRQDYSLLNQLWDDRTFKIPGHRVSRSRNVCLKTISTISTSVDDKLPTNVSYNVSKGFVSPSLGCRCANQ